MESHSLLGKFHVFPPRNSMTYKPGPPFCRIAKNSHTYTCIAAKSQSAPSNPMARLQFFVNTMLV